MKRNTSHTIKRAQRFPVILIGEGLLVGAVGGLIVRVYKRKSTADCGMVCCFDAACSACRETDKMGTDDIGERNTAG